MFRCVRIAGDLVHDLGLDEDNAEQTGLQGSEEHLDGLRAYLGYYYLESVYVVLSLLSAGFLTNS